MSKKAYKCHWIIPIIAINLVFIYVIYLKSADIFVNCMLLGSTLVIYMFFVFIEDYRIENYIEKENFAKLNEDRNKEFDKSMMLGRMPFYNNNDAVSCTESLNKDMERIKNNFPEIEKEYNKFIVAQKIMMFEMNLSAIIYMLILILK